MSLNKPPSDLVVGSEHMTLKSGLVRIIKYNGCKDIDVIFPLTGTILRGLQNSNIRKGAISDPFYPNNCNIGYMGLGRFNSRSDKAAYHKWTNMLVRVYKPKNKQEAKDYLGCSVSEDWLCFQNFCEWYYKQPFVNHYGYELDKDLIVRGNKLYSPSLCSIIPKKLNSALSYDRRVNQFGVGVTKVHSLYKASITSDKIRTYLGSFETREEAVAAFIYAREINMDKLSDELLSEGKITPEQAALVKTNYGTNS